jgi:hypothetical protein
MDERGADGADRTKRVKEARDEAKKEIEEYRKGKDDEFKKFEAEVRLLASLSALCYNERTIYGLLANGSIV